MKHLFPVIRRALCCVPAALLVAPAALHAQAQTGMLMGRVLSGDVAVPSATIIARGVGARATLTRVDGRYRMTLPAGRYTVRASRIGYSSASDTVVVSAGGTATLNLKLERADSPLEAVASVGARRNDRSVIDAQLPTAVYQAADLKATGRTQLSEMIQALVPGFNVSHADNAVGSASLRGSSLRSMSPDEMLVLVNGRRRHTSALLNTTDALGRGTAVVDLDAIPPSMVERVEVMSGSAAQFGSGAIAGVINVVLKSGVHGDATGTLGERKTTYNRDDGMPASAVPTGERSVSDGRLAQAAIDKGIVFGERGFMHGALEFRDEGYTNRSLPDRRALYAPGDPRAATSPLDPQRMLWLRGRPDQRDVALFLNGGNLLANGLEVYGNLGLSRRVGETSPFYAGPLDFFSTSATYPDGFRPVFSSTSDDASGTAGVRGFLDDWTWDLGTTYGRNQLAVRGREGLNRNILTPTEEGLTGTLVNEQWITTLDLTRIYSVFDELRFAAGGEFRANRYEIRSHESATYDPVGFRSFTADSGFLRNTAGAYLDVEADLSPAFTLGMTGRADRVSDFGTFGTGGLTARYELAPKAVLRAAASTGYHAPDLAQTKFAHAVDYPAGVRYVTGADMAGAMGAVPVTVEHSRNFQAGLALEPSPALSLTLDAYRTELRGRSMLGFYRYTSSFGVMANTMDTRTDGVSASATHVTHLENGGVLKLSAGLDVSSVSILRVDSVSSAVTPLGYYRPAVVDQAEIVRVRNGQPGSNLLFSGRYDQGMLGALVRTQRFGSVSAGDSVIANTIQDFRAKWITDASLSLKLHRLYTFTIGADNLFDVYPDRNNQPGNPITGVRGNDYFNILPYNPVSPFGYSGRFIYGRFSYYL